MPALPFPMVGRISPQTPEPGTHQHCSETLCTAHYSLPTLLAAQTKQLPPSSASRSANISPVLSSFRILPVATGVYPASFPRFRRSDLQPCQRFCLQELAAPLPSFVSPPPLPGSTAHWSHSCSPRRLLGRKTGPRRSWRNRRGIANGSPVSTMAAPSKPS